MTQAVLTKKSGSPLRREISYSLHLLVRNKLVLAGVTLAISLSLVAVVGPFFVPSGTNTQLDMTGGNLATLGNSQISWQHPLGVDILGRDMLGMIVLALALDMRSAFIVVACGIVIGSLLGSFSGYVGGKLEEIIMRVTDIFLAFPQLILALGIAAALGRNLNNLVLALIIVSWPVYTRLMRGQVLVEKQRLYAESLRALGISRLRIVLRHMLPNSIYPLLVQSTLDIAGVILTLASLSFLGFSVDYFTPELGRMTLDGANYLQTNPLLVTFPGVTILLVSLAFNLCGDGLRDVLDPRLRR